MGLSLRGIVVWVASFAFFGVDMRTIGVGMLMLGLTGNPVLAVLIDGLVGGVRRRGRAARAVVRVRQSGREAEPGRRGTSSWLFVVGLFLGLAASVLNLIVACVVGIVFSLATQRSRRDSEDPRVFPFGPSIALATWFTLVAGPSILGWYLSLF